MADKKTTTPIEDVLTVGKSIDQQVNELILELTSPHSEIGDYKIVKIYEARLEGRDDPYDATDLISKRQAVRDEINKLQGNPTDAEITAAKKNSLPTEEE